jgi:transposase
MEANVTAGRKTMEERRIAACETVKKGADLRARKPPGRPARLTAEQLLELHSLWAAQEKWTAESFAKAIHLFTGVKYDPDHVGRLIIRLGLREKRVKKPAVTPAEFGRMFEEMAHA